MYYDYYTFDVTYNGLHASYLVLRAWSEMEAYEKAYQRIPDCCYAELTEIEPAI